MVFGDFKLVKLSKANMLAAKELCDRYVGVGMYNMFYLDRILRDKSHYFFLVKKGFEYAGYFYCQRIIADSLSCLSGLNYRQVSSLCGPLDEVGVLRSIGIESKYRGLGLSDALIQYFEDYFMKKCNISLILVPAWSKDGYVPAKKLLERCEFKYLCDLITPWENHKELMCPYCKKEHCICNAVVYYRKVGHEKD